LELNVFVAARVKVAGEDFDVLSYRLVESLDEPSQLTLEIVRAYTAEQPDPAALVGTDVEFELERTDASSRRAFYGFVASAERTPDDTDIDSVVLEVVPKLWRLGKRRDCRIFQNKTTQQIVESVLEGGGVPKDRQDWQLSASYEPRVYCTQYRETDLEFVRRLLAEDGIWFAVRMQDGADRVVLSDNPQGSGTIEGKSTLPFDAGIGLEASTDSVVRVQHVHRVRSDKVQLREYDAARPKLKLQADAEGADEGEHTLEVYEWPGRYTKEADGTRYATVMLQGLQARRELVTGETGVMTLRPGERFTIEEHPYAPINQEHLIVRVVLESVATSTTGDIEGQTAQRFAAHFEAIPTAKCKYRPERRERALAVPGLQTAFTTGPAGEEIHVHGQGEVTAQFHWDRLGKRDDKSSTWMRTSQLATGGSMLLPRVDWEVTVAYRDGDADQPFVMGRMYNAEKPAPYDLPSQKGSSSIQTATTPGGGSSNEVRLGDDKGNESMFFNGSYDMTIDVVNNTTSSVGKDLTKKVGSNQVVNVTDSVTSTIGSNQTLDVGGNQSIVVKTYMTQQIDGGQNLTVGGNRTKMIGGDHKREVTGSSTLTVGGNHFDLTVGDISDHTLASFNHTVGAALIEITTADRSFVVGAANTENTGAAKIIGTIGGRGVAINGVFTQNVGGALIYSVKGSKSDKAGASWTEVAGGAQFVKATNIVFEAETMLTLVMGASIIMMMPGMIMVTAVQAKLDGNVVGQMLTLDN
jgi:type VI secretion system secreted protein VgrG